MPAACSDSRSSLPHRTPAGRQLPRGASVPRQPNTGDKLRGARTLRPVDDDSATALRADYHASLRLLPRLVSFIALFDCAPCSTCIAARTQSAAV